MTKRSVVLACCGAAQWLALCATACTPSGGPKTGTQTNWLSTCQTDSECGALQCLCGACTRSCSDAPSCNELPEASCVAAEDAGAIALCGGTPPASAGLCLVPCPAEGCEAGTSCVAGVCVPAREPTSVVSIDDSRRFQTLVGFGAGIAYMADEIAQHPRREALFDAMFADSGLNVLRLRNRTDDAGAADVASTS
jgi:hypothetical protein